MLNRSTPSSDSTTTAANRSGVSPDLRDELQIAQAALGGDEFPDGCTHHRLSHSDLEAAEDRRQRLGQADLEEGREPARAHRLHEVDHLLLGRAHADHRVDDDGEERDQEGDHDLRQDPVAEPHHQNRRQRHFRDGLQRHHERKRNALENSGIDHRDGKRDGDKHAEPESEQDFLQGDDGVRQQQLPGDDDLCDDYRGSRQDVIRNAQCANGDLPQREDGCKDAEHGAVAADPSAEPPGRGRRVGQFLDCRHHRCLFNLQGRRMRRPCPQSSL